jgi:hypothetical protein
MLRVGCRLSRQAALTVCKYGVGGATKRKARPTRRHCSSAVQRRASMHLHLNYLHAHALYSSSKRIANVLTCGEIVSEHGIVCDVAGRTVVKKTRHSHPTEHTCHKS